MASHCLPNGQLGSNELPVPNISGATITTFNPPAGMSRRGVVVYMHGLYVTAQQFSVPPSTANGAAAAAGDTYSGFGSMYAASLCTNLANDGWVVLAVIAQEDTFAGVPSTGLYNDAGAEQIAGGYGARYQNSTLRTWDHVYQYIQQTYGDWPVVAMGVSLGGWRATTIAQSRPQTVKGVISHQPLTVFETLPMAYTITPTFGVLNWSGVNDVPTELNAITCPALIGYSSGDVAVGAGGNSTVATINGATTGVAAASVTALTVSGGSTSFYGGTATGSILVTGLTGGTGRAVYNYVGTNYSAGTFATASLTFVAGSGSGTVGVGATVVQSYTDTICTNAVAAGKSVTRNSGSDPHGISLGFSGAYYTGSGFTLSAGANTGLTVPITSTQALTPLGATQGLLAGACAIQDSTGVWRPITAIGGITTPNLTGVTITGPGTGTATIATNAPICNTGTAITGGYSNMSIPYWVNTVLDPSYPKTY